MKELPTNRRGGFPHVKEHERGLRLAIHQLVLVGTTWGGPVLGGAASMNPGGFRVQFQILCAFQAISSLLVAFAVPETAYDRSFVFLNTPATAASYERHQSLKPRGNIDVEAVKEYLGGMQPHSYSALSITKDLLLQAPRAMIAPTAMLLLLVSFLPFSALWAVAATLSMLFAHLPFELTPASIGALLTGPFLLGVGTVAFFSLAPWWRSRQSLAPMNVLAVALGSFLVFMSLLGAGLHAESAMMAPMMATSGDDGMATAAEASETSPFMVGGFAGRLSFPGIGVLLALLAAGVYAVDAAVRPMIAKSTQFTSSNLGVALRNTVDMESSLVLARSALAGIFVMAAPSMVSGFDALRSTLVGFGVSQLCVAAAVGVVWWLWGQEVLVLDGRIMKCVDLLSLRRTGSFFDTD